MDEAGQDQVDRLKTRARKPLQREKDLEELFEVVQKQDQVPMLQVASQDTQAKVPPVEEDEEAAKDPKRQEVKQDVEEDLLPSHKLVTKALASRALEDLKPVTATVLLVTKLDPLQPARSQVQKNTEPPADLERRVMIGCRVITGAPATSILRPCSLCQASPTSSLLTCQNSNMQRTINLFLHFNILG